MIYLFIAASTTPYCLLAVPGELSDVVPGFVWFGTGAAVVVIATRFEASHPLALLGSLALLYTEGAGVRAARWPDPAPKVHASALSG
jgi:predicted membrane channel-forming protein YqfA (hemolysin III family)